MSEKYNPAVPKLYYNEGRLVTKRIELTKNGILSCVTWRAAGRLVENAQISELNVINQQ